jgi:uncharacterized protein YyaL (SSP411 family)
VAFAESEDTESVSIIPLLENRGMINERATAYICHQYRCEAPVNDAATLLKQLAG